MSWTWCMTRLHAWPKSDENSCAAPRDLFYRDKSPLDCGGNEDKWAFDSLNLLVEVGYASTAMCTTVVHFSKEKRATSYEASGATWYSTHLNVPCLRMRVGF